MRRSALCLLAALMLTGCTIPGLIQPSASPSAPASNAPASGSATSAATPPSATPSASVPDLPVIAARKATINGDASTISLNEVAVRNGVTSITWTLTNNMPTGKGDTGIQMTSNVFSDGQNARVPGTDEQIPEDSYYVDGVFLIDTVNKLRYLPARDANGVCVCTYAPSSIFIRPGTSESFNAVFKALPDGVSTIDVSIPHAGTFGDVPVQR